MFAVDAKVVVLVLLLFTFIHREGREPKHPAPEPPVSLPDGSVPEPDLPEGLLDVYISRRNPRLSREERNRMIAGMEACREEEGLHPALVAALIARESGFDPRAYSPSGAMGLGQLKPETAKEVGVSDPFDPVQNIAGTCRYLSKQIERFREGSDPVRQGLAAYKIGWRAVQNDPNVLQRQDVRDYIEAILSDVESLSAP